MDFLIAEGCLGDAYHRFTPEIVGARRYLAGSDAGLQAASLPVQVISLAGSARREVFSARWHLPLPFRFFDAVDARARDFDPCLYPEYRDHLPPHPTGPDLGHLGCALSHFRLWQDLSETGLEVTLVLEDDAVALPYGHRLLGDVLRHWPADADIVLVNGGSCEKLYCALQATPPYAGFPSRPLYARSEVVQIMNENYERIRRYNGKRVVWNGTYGYLLSRRGAIKLAAFVERHGLPPFSNRGGSTNVDILLSLLTTGRQDHRGNPVGFDARRAEELGLFPQSPYLRGYVSSVPLVGSSEKYLMGLGSEIHGR